MVEQPSGTVTLVFTDIEGSTRLLADLGQEAYHASLVEHREIVREAFGRHGGYEVHYEGDAFFYAFASAREAVTAVAEAQAGLAGGPIRIRVGIHTGEPGLDPPKYVGVDVHLAARIMSAGHGGQALLSDATRVFVDVDVTELGEHRLKDIEQPVPLQQLGSERFPPLKTISNTNLPRPASSFVGREREVVEVAALVRESRLVTLTGPGGTGKTRLSIEAASELVGEFKAGVFWVGLATLQDPSLVTETIARTLGAKCELAAHIADREMLLLLDNFEQVVDAAPELSRLLRTCPSLRVLVTSRQLLRIDGEVEYPVPTLSEREAVELFCSRSRLESDATIAELCRRLDDLPLAVELAAARTAVLTPAQILDRLGQGLDLLKGGRDADPRQQTLRATIEWSHDLLSPQEQRLFARLAVFPGGCTVNAAEEVAGADLETLESLVDKSLVRRAADRFLMLETIREHASERLAEAGEAERLCGLLAEFAIKQAAYAEDADDALWRKSIRADYPNLRSALEWLAERPDDARFATLVCRLARYWHSSDQLREGAAWITAMLTASKGVDRERIQARLVLSQLFRRRGDLEAARIQANRAVAEAVSIGDLALQADANGYCGSIEYCDGNFDEAGRYMAVGIDLFEQLGRWEDAGGLKHDLGLVALVSGSFSHARALFEEARDVGARARRPGLEAGAIANLGYVALAEEKPTEALAYFGDSLHLYQASHLAEVAAECDGYGFAAAIATTDLPFARMLVASFDAHCEEIGAVIEPVHEAARSRVIAVADARLAAQDVEDAVTRGRATPAEEAIRLAVRALD